MRRLGTLLIALTMLAAGAAEARGWGGGAPRGERGGRGGFAQPMRPGPGPGPGPGGGFYSRGPGPGPGPRGGYPVQGYPGAAYARPPMGYAPAMPPPRGGFRRGEFIPRALDGGQVLDPRRYHLRTPPPGYMWYGVGRDAYLVQRSTGMILDTAPGAW